MWMWTWCTTGNGLCVRGPRSYSPGAQVKVYVDVVLVHNK